MNKLNTRTKKIFNWNVTDFNNDSYSLNNIILARKFILCNSKPLLTHTWIFLCCFSRKLINKCQGHSNLVYSWELKIDWTVWLSILSLMFRSGPPQLLSLLQRLLCTHLSQLPVDDRICHLQKPRKYHLLRPWYLWMLEHLSSISYSFRNQSKQRPLY